MAVPEKIRDDFVRAVGRPEPALDLARAALLVAAESDARVDVDSQIHTLESWAAELSARLEPGWNNLQKLARLRSFVFEDLGFRGDSKDYFSPSNSLLHQVMERRLGVPLTLSIIFMELGWRIGIPFEGVGFPGHFLVRVGGPSGVLIDPFNGGKPLDDDGLSALLRRSAGQDARLSASHVQPVGMRAIWIRMLANLRAIHEQRSDHRSALVVCDRLVELDAGPPARRDRGLHALALGAGAAAASDLDSYLKAAPNAPDRAEVERALSRASLGTSWN